MRGVASAGLTLALWFVPGSALHAQDASKTERKLLTSVKPQYPEFLKRAQIGGLVRLRASVLANGTVANVEVIGGNPILAESSVAAVMKWKFIPSSAQTTEKISFSFSPH